MPVTTEPKHKEHKLASADFTKAQLKTYATQLKAWLAKHEMHENTLAVKVGCSGQQLRNVMKEISQPSYSLSAALFRETGIRPIG